MSQQGDIFRTRAAELMAQAEAEPEWAKKLVLVEMAHDYNRRAEDADREASASKP